MNRIEQFSNWCWIDQLDGHDLDDGDELIVKWPDGFLEQVKIHVIRKSVDTQDHGVLTSVTDSRAYYRTTVRDVPVLVPLVGLEAQFVKKR